MNYNGVLAVLVGAVTIAASSTAVSLSGATYASFSDTEASTPDTVGAATVVLDRGGKGPDLKYSGLRPGVPQEVDLRADYDGSVPADLGLSVAPKGDSPLCRRSGDQRWVAQPGRAVTVRVGTAPAVSYCSLYAGGRLPLAAGVTPGSRTTARVVVTLAADFVPPADGLTVTDVTTVHADGGFSDTAVGTIELRVEKPGKGGKESAAAVPAAATAIVAAGAGDAVVLDAADPASAARTVARDTVIALPEQCAAAGMSAADIAEVVVLEPADPSWDAAAERGTGAGPFLVLGTAGDDTVVGSDGADCIVGGAGDDRLSGGDAADVVLGDDGTDTLNGDDGDDRLDGGERHDTLRGGRGADHLAGGPGGAVCDVAADDRAADCDPPEPVTEALAPGPPAEPLPAPPVEPAPAPVPPAPLPDEAAARERAPVGEAGSTPPPPPSPAPREPSSEAAGVGDAEVGDAGVDAVEEPAPSVAAAPQESPAADVDDTPPTTEPADS